MKYRKKVILLGLLCLLILPMFLSGCAPVEPNEVVEPAALIPYETQRSPYEEDTLGLETVEQGLIISPSEVNVSVADIHSSTKLIIDSIETFDAYYQNGYAIRWESNDPSVVTVDDTGTVTFIGPGSAIVQASILTSDNMTYSTDVRVQVGETPIRVLSIGNSFSRDCLYYLSNLASKTGKRIEAVYLEKDGGTLRHHADNLADGDLDYAQWKSNAYTGQWTQLPQTSLASALEQWNWDFILLHQGVVSVGFPGTYNSDLEYLSDYIKTAQPHAKLLWNMTWALRDGHITQDDGADFHKYYGSNEQVMYNAIVKCLEQFILKDSTAFDDWIPTGVAIQNLRKTLDHDLRLTRDGVNLSLDIGRLTAAMTLLASIYPETDWNLIPYEQLATMIDTDKLDEGICAIDKSKYVFNMDHIPLVIDAVESACSLDSTPATFVVTQPVSENAEITIAQAEAPLLLHFPDVKMLPSDGTLIAAAYENVAHYPSRAVDSVHPDDAMEEGVGRLLVWRSKADSQTIDTENPILIVDQGQIEAWGIGTTSSRYKRLQRDSNASYLVMCDPRDPNLAVINTDLDGNGTEDEVLLFTFWIRYYDQDGNEPAIRLYLITGTRQYDQWQWSTPQMLESPQFNTQWLCKRGDIASFADGSILIPYYCGSKVGTLHMEWNSETKDWKLLRDSEIPNLAPEESTKFNEVSLCVPNPVSNTVYAFCRDNGSIMRSDNRGISWTEVGNEDGLIHQPGFAVIEQDRVFAVWTRNQPARPIIGKLFCLDKDWQDTTAQVVYMSPNAAKHDMGDPSAVLLKNGRILVVGYDTAYRSIIGMIEDPNDVKWISDG